MQKLSRLFPLLLAFQVLSCLGQSSDPSGLLPGPVLPPPLPKLTAILNGANAIPSNKSPFIARAICGLASFTIPAYEYSLYIEVEFRVSQITNNPNVVPDWPSIQYHDGSVVEDPGCSHGGCPFILSPPPPPWLPFFDGCPEVPLSPGQFVGRLAGTPEQVVKLAQAHWELNRT